MATYVSKTANTKRIAKNRTIEALAAVMSHLGLERDESLAERVAEKETGAKSEQMMEVPHLSKLYPEACRQEPGGASSLGRER